MAARAATAADPAADIAAHDRPLLASRHTGLLMAAVMGVSVIQFLDMTIANVALPHMAASLGATVDTISWVLTSFIIAGVLTLPLTGWLTDRVGSRRMFIGATAAFLIASMACGAATSLGQMVAFRAIQGAAASFMAPLSQTIMFDLNRPSKQAQAMSVWGMAVMIGPISGPFIGGFLTDALNWRWVFYVNLPLGIPAVAVLWWLLPTRPIVPRRLDVFGAVVLGIALVALQLMLDRGERNDWFEARETLIELLIALSAFWVFFVHSRTVANPLFPRALTRNPNFIAGVAFTTILGLTNVALSAVLPSMYQGLFGYSVMQSGMLMAPRGLGMMMTMMVVNRLTRRVDGRLVITFGYAICAWSMWLMTRWTLVMDWRPLALALFVQGFGMGLIFVPVNMISFSTLDPHMRTEGTTLLTLFRNLGGSFGISAIVTMLGRNTQISHADLGAHVTSFNIPGIDPAAAAGMAGSLGDAALAALNAEVTRQAAMIAYLDNFYAMFWLVAAIAPLAWLVRRPQPIGGRPAPGKSGGSGARRA